VTRIRTCHETICDRDCDGRGRGDGCAARWRGLEGPPCAARRSLDQAPGLAVRKMCVRCGRVTARVAHDGLPWCGGDWINAGRYTRASPPDNPAPRAPCPARTDTGAPVPLDTWLVTGTRVDDPYPCRCEERRRCNPRWCPCANRTGVLDHLPETCCARRGRS
jgi:hypothetical protein